MKDLTYITYRVKSILILICIMSMISNTLIAQVSPAERQALIDLYNATDGDNWANTLSGDRPWLVNDPASPVSDWFGVTVVDNKVTRIYLFGGGVAGSLPNSIGDLVHLTALTITRSYGLSGNIPSTIGNLTKLQSLDLGGNILTGDVPASLGNLTLLTYLNLSVNNLDGVIPVELGNLVGLTQLGLTRNALTGSIPASLSNLVNLTALNLSLNQLTGSIPTALTTMTNLTNLSLARNGLSGTIPEELSNLTNLTSLDLSSNKFTGDIPASLGNLTSLTYLNLAINLLDGSIPAEIGNLTALTQLGLTRNALSGTIPASLSNLANLTALNLSLNQLTGSIPSELGMMTNLTSLSVARNPLSGTIPPELGSLINLETLDLSSNAFTGEIPNTFGNLSNLKVLQLYRNQFSGSIPAELGNLTKLTTLGLSTNQLSGSVPANFGILASSDILNTLTLDRNNFVFNDFEAEFPVYQSDLTAFNYLTQAKVDEIETISIAAGEAITLSSNDLTSTNNSYQWYKNNVAIPGATNKNLVISSAKDTDTGVYYFTATNSGITDLTLTRNPITLEIGCGVSEAEKQALIDLYNSTDGPNWTNNTNWLTDAPVCDWAGVTVVDGKVTGLSFSNNGLDGAIPATFGNLIHLKSIVMVINRIRGPLPDVFDNLVNVETFTLERNAITGDIPQSIGSMAALKVLNLGSNGFTGNIPSSLGNLSNLINLSLFANQLSGTIPASLGNLSNLERLILFRNAIGGEIPATLGNLLKLIIIDLNYNALTGSIPSELGNLQNLIGLNFSVNRLTGTIPTSFGQLSSLESLYLNQNQLEGEIPNELGQMTSLTHLYIHTNRLTGSIPATIGNLLNLREMVASYNELSGRIPSEIGQLGSLTSLYIQDNQLSGPIPTEMGQMTALIRIHVYNNKLSGSIPASLGSLPNISELVLSFNELSGSVPTEIGNLTTLTGLYLHNNQLSGDIPKSIKDLPSLSSFQIQNNQYVFSNFESEHPDYLSSFRTYAYNPQAKVDEIEAVSIRTGESITLTTAELTSPNNSYQWFKDGVAISGATNKDLVIENASATNAGAYYFTATNSVLTDLTLERNPITLTVTEGVADCVSAEEKAALVALFNSTDGANWTNNVNWLSNEPVSEWAGVIVEDCKVTRLFLGDNNLVGVLPNEIGDLINLEQLHLNTNSISSTIPDQIGNLSNLKLLYLYGNEISGVLPESIGNLTNLNNLSLASNKLEGDIPSTFSNLTNIIALSLGGNIGITGGVSFLFELPNISSLEVWSCNLTEEFTTDFDYVNTSLTKLIISNNGLTGVFDFGKYMPNLQNLYVQDNELNGEFPAYGFTKLLNIERLYIERNQIFGSIPVGPKLEKLIRLDFSENNLEGQIPDIFTDSSLMRDFHINNNKFSGKLPLFGVSSLTKVFVFHNNFVFDDFQASYNDAAFSYNFQAPLEAAPDQTISQGDTLTILANERLLEANNQYAWFKSDDGGATFVTTGITSKDYSKENIDVDDAGIYKLQITNPTFPGVTLTQESTLITINANTCGVSESEKQALIDLYNSTDGSNWTNNTNWLTDAPVCDWYGVTVVDGKVIELRLGNNNLVGQIPSTIQDLTSIEYLSLALNKLNGMIPNEIGSLSNLKKLYLNSNSLTGAIPQSIGNLTNLTNFYLNDNNLTGAIPSSITSLLRLEYLYLHENQIEGSIPNDIGSLRNIIVLNLGYNNLEGTIPVSIGNFFKTTFIYLNNNRITGVIPNEIGSLPRLTALNVNSNFLEGAIPPSLKEVTSFKTLSIQENNFVFEEMEAEFDALKNKLTTFRYSPQAKVDQTETLSVEENGTITLTSTALTSENNSYQWYKTVNGTTTEITGATSKDLVITDASEADAGVYHFTATNSVVADLTLERNPITLTVTPVVDTCGVSESEKQALIDLYNSTDGANWTNNTNWLTDAPVCDWYGVTVRDAKIVWLDLNGNNLTGEISDSIYNLEYLEILRLYSNSLSGNISPNIRKLVNLQFLHLRSNILSGEIPNEIFQIPTITRIDLGRNNFEGFIDEEILNLSGLTDLRLNDNKFRGEISHLFDLSNLQTALYLHNNGFVFSNFEPKFELFQPVSNLDFRYAPQAKVDQTETLDVTEGGSITLTSTALTSANNQYRWFKDGIMIDTDAGGLRDYVITNATTADAGVYHFTATNTVVTGLTLERNPITLTVTEDTCGVSAAEKQALIDLYNSTDGANWINNTNWLTDAPVCDWYGVTVVDGKVTELDLRSNNLLGDISTVIFGDLSSLVNLNLETNSLKGDLSEIGTLRNLEVLNLSANNFSGELSRVISQNEKLGILNLRQNNFSGSIDTVDIGYFTLLTYLDLSENNFEDEIPVEISQLINLDYLNLSNNNLTSFIPGELGLLRSLRYLYLNQNGLIGAIPSELGNLSQLTVINLSKNSLSSSIPDSLGQLSNLTFLSVEENMITGEIPESLGNLSQLVALYLSRNQLSGSLPLSLGDLPKLVTFVLNDNNLSGPIPSGLELSATNDVLNSLGINTNNFVFSDFESYYVSLKNNLTGFTYSPQAKVDQEQTIEVQLGGSVTLSTTQLTSINNTYTWYKGTDVLIETTLPQITIDNITASDLGEYYFTATNSVIDGLTLTRNKITLVLGNTDPDGCDVLEGIADGSFESCASVASTGGNYNGNDEVICSNWIDPDGLTNTWIAPVQLSSNPLNNRRPISTNVVSSPNGGVFAGMQSNILNIINGESVGFYTSLTDLKIGSTYKISFYQANGSTYISSIADGSGWWTVKFENQEKNSNPLFPIESPLWEEVVMEFTAQTTSLNLSFTPNFSRNDMQSFTQYYMLIDGIKVTNVGGDCANDITEQRFCADNEAPATVGDLISPIPNTTVTWFTEENSDAAFLPDEPLVNDFIYWARSNNNPLLPRAGVKVILESGTPAGPSTQIFNAVNNPTVADLQATGSNIQWYSSESGEIPLASSTELISNTSYYAAEGSSICRLQILVTINTVDDGDCDVLEGVADGSFESCFGVASVTNYEEPNYTVDCSNWNPINLNNLLSTWKISPLVDSNQNVEITNLLEPSPNGAAFASFRINITENSPVGYLSGLKTTLQNLEIGAEYEVSFYQSNGGSKGAGTSLVSNSWAVRWGGLSGTAKAAPLMIIEDMEKIDVAPKWDLIKMSFTATGTNEEIDFFPSKATELGNFDTQVLYHILIDGIKVTKVGGDCTNDITEQRFCADNETPATVADLISPIPNTTVTWFTGENSDAAFLPDEPLVNDFVYWARSNNNPLLPRAGVKVILESGTPAGPSTQIFNAVNNPTVADLQATGSNIQWYSSESGEIPLASSTELISNASYYAAEGSSICRLKVLVTIDTSEDGDCDVLEGVVDGSFQDCALVSGSTQSGYNNNIECSGWEPINSLSSPSTWIVDLSDPVSDLNPVMTSHARQSPDGGIFASALVTHGRGTSNLTKRQGFKTTLNNLEIGKTYTISFYQSQGGSFDVLGNTTVPNSENILAQWNVSFGSETKSSDLIPIQSISAISVPLVWEKQEITFVPTATQQELSFSSFGSLINVVENVFYYNLLIDGIKVIKQNCDPIDPLIQEFCLSEGVPTINDLESPFPNSIAWFENETGGAPLPSAMEITETVTLWAEGSSSNPRVEVRIVIKEGADCLDNLIQEFCIENGIVTINDLESPFPNSIAWFENETGGAPLPSAMQITETVTLWAEGSSSNPRVAVQIIIKEKCDDIAIQRFCILNGDVTIGDLQSPFLGSTASWHRTELDKALVFPEYVILESAIWWAQSDANPSLPRVPVSIILDDQVPTGDTIQIFDEADAPTVADLQVTGLNIQWYLSENGEVTLSNDTPLVHNTYYYAANGNSKCRLRVAVRIEGVVTDCNILDQYVDGSFENCESIASTYGHNSNVTCGQWINGKGSADTWKFPFNASHSGIAKNLQPSPDNGVAAGAIAKSLNTNELESFYTNLNGLNIGETYRIEFYQSNVTGNFNATEGLEEARWKVIFGDQIQYSAYMVVTENPVWQKSTLDFIANTTEAKLEFNASSTNKTKSTTYVYMLIDGIKLSQLTGNDTGCPDDIVYDTQSFCSMFDDPTVGDLLPPEGATDVLWYSSEVNGYQYSPEDILLVGGNGIPSTNVYWAESSQFTGRKPVRVIINEGIPSGNTLQVFDVSNNPTVADLEVTGNNVQWFSSPMDQIPLQENVELINGYTYYAGHNGLDCRLAVEVEIKLSPLDVDGIQVLCASDSPTIGDLVAIPSDPSYTISWYDSIDSDTALSEDTRIENSGFYYVSQNTGDNSVSERISVYVSLISVSAPIGASEQTIYTNDGATVRNLVAIGTGVIWYDGNGVQLSLDEPLEDGGIYYADQTSVSGTCRSIDRLVVRVRILPELPPQYFSCEKFRPQPGDKYVVSGWVRENGVTIASTETKNYSEISELFAKLLNELKDIIVTQTPVPPVYIPSPEDRTYDDLVPYIKTTGIDNLTIYNLKPVKEDQGGFVRTVGFSFSFDEEGETTFSYKTPLNSFTSNNIYYSFPIIGNEDTISIDFTGVQTCTEGLCVNTNFTYNTVIVIIPISINYTQSIPVSNVLKESVDFNTYVPDPDYQAMTYANSLLNITYTDREGKELPDGASISFRPKGNIIDGWQRISADFRIPNNAEFMTISLQSEDTNLNVYFDDIRFHPFDSNMKTFVYDPETQRLQSELDENNYATFYEYDKEGGLIRVKKETERGVYTIQETRSGNSKLNNN
ncbi:leucine-rich repeat domain-containing protein [Aquimarina rubra]|uniref:Ig-like domain-containing protein n=1 Tax=Aquimarina rubra TaxID=1920033 RepID=A0ABW5LAR2_9FLAO